MQIEQAGSTTRQKFARHSKPDANESRIFCNFPSRETVMSSRQKRFEIMRLANAPFIFSTIIGSAFLWTDAACASQGPGGGLGTASPLIQLTMAVIVYGGSALVVAAGLIGAARGR
jgi:hypothetical protein